MAGRAASTVVLLLLTSIVATAFAAENTNADRNRLIFDPKTNDWIDVPAPEPGTENGDLDIARALLAERKYVQARKAFREWFKRYPDSPRRPEALFYAADVETYAANEGKPNDLWQAHEWYEEILNGWAGTEWAERALRRELVVAELFLFKGQKRKIWKGFLRVSATEEALEILDRIVVDRAPGTLLAEQALLMQANYHFDHGEFDEAEKAYARLSRDYPRGKYVRLALERSADSALASFAGIEFDDAPLLEAEERYRQFEDRFPKAAQEDDVPATLANIRNRRAEKEYSIAEYYLRAKHPQAALYYFKSVAANWPDTVWAEKARLKLEALGPGAPPPQLNEPTTGTTQPTSDVAPAPTEIDASANLKEAPAAPPKKIEPPRPTPIPDSAQIETVPVESAPASPPPPKPAPSAPPHVEPIHPVPTSAPNEPVELETVPISP